MPRIKVLKGHDAFVTLQEVKIKTKDDKWVKVPTARISPLRSAIPLMDKEVTLPAVALKKVDALSKLGVKVSVIGKNEKYKSGYELGKMVDNYPNAEIFIKH